MIINSPFLSHKNVFFKTDIQAVGVLVQPYKLHAFLNYHVRGRFQCNYYNVIYTGVNL